MLNSRLAYSVLALLAIGCVGTVGSDSSEELGHTSLPLMATTATGVVYRLNKATFVIKDMSCNKVVATVKPDPNKAVQDVSLKPGTYAISLSSGWVLQRKVGSAWEDTTGKLTGQPTGSFKIKARETVTLTYSFGFDPTATPTSTTPTPLNPLARSGCNGTARIAMTVTDPPAPAVDCNLYSSKVSALAAFTIDCLGTLDATQYLMQSDGHLARNFTSCTTADPFPDPNGDDSRIASIDGILSLQYPRTDLPPDANEAIAKNQAYSTQCIAVTWYNWSKGTHPNVCPQWAKIGSTNSPDNPDHMGSLTSALPAPFYNDLQQQEVIQTPADLVLMEKAGATYGVFFPDGSPDPDCGSIDACVRACAGGFPGFVLASDDGVVSTDPAYWELATKYGDGDDPFLAAGYYHAMADYGPVPGDQFGHAQRAKQIDADGNVGEACSYYLSGKRFYTRLQLSTNGTGSVSWCRAPGAVIQ